MTATRRHSPQPPLHRLTVPAGPADGTGAREEMQGKIKGGGTLWPTKPVCTGVLRDTPPVAARCRASAQCLVLSWVRVCLARPSALQLSGAQA